MIESIPSQTAVRVALSVVTLSVTRETRHLMPEGLGDATAELLTASGLVDRRQIARSRHPLAAAAGTALNPWMSGQFHAFAPRKAFFQQVAVDAIDRGATQVLVLGAGFDTLCWRLAPDNPAVQFLEIDHPATSVAKIKGIRKMGQPENMTMISADLSQTPLLQVLDEEAGWNTDASSVIIAEGLLMYLAPEDVLDLLRQSAESVGGNSGFGFSHFHARSDGRPDLGIFGDYTLAGLRLIGEPVRWAISREKLTEFLQGTGWKRTTPDRQPKPAGAGIEGYCLLEST